MQPILSIAVVTMNRAGQLEEALRSCLRCELPDETEFVIIDNASVDNTEQIVNGILKTSGYSFYYQKTKVNIGAGGGRNRCFEKSKGTYVYGMDDDAVIDFKNNPDFFMKAIKIMDENPLIVTLATQIYDRAWGCNRQTISGREILPGIYKCRMFCGGSHFLKKSFFKDAPYFSNQYGYEELPPSLLAYDAGMINAICPDIIAIHQPSFNKWDYEDEKNHALVISECAVPYAIKKMMYPRIYAPILWLSYTLRCNKYLSRIPGSKVQANAIVEETMRQHRIVNRIKNNTVRMLYRDFGKSIF